MLTKRGKHEGQDIPMCGVPVERADDYLHRLIGLGHRVAVCEQMEDPAQAKERGNKSRGAPLVNTLKELVKTPAGGRNPTVLAPDHRNNAILVSGSRTERIRMRLLIEKLDGKPNQSNSNTQVVYLNYLRAEDLAPILVGIAQANFSGNVGMTIGTITRPVLDSTNPASNLANGTSSSSQSASMQPTPAAPAANAATPNTTGTSTQNEGTTKPSVQIIAEPNTNSVIINAPASLIRILKSVITKLDILPAQLLIEALVAEVDERDITSLGIEWAAICKLVRPLISAPDSPLLMVKPR